MLKRITRSKRLKSGKGRVALLVAVLFVTASTPILAAAGMARSHSDSLLSGFESPPQSAKPRVWWHWLGGNISKDGIAKDLAWMHGIGIGGVDQIEGDLMTQPITKPQLPYMSPEWKDAFQYATGIAGKYGMEFSINTSAGWSETGGPSVAPEQAMKKLVWSATSVEGGKRFEGVLKQPPSTTGPIQNVPIAGDVFASTPSKIASIQFYRDSAVIAYRDPVSAPAIAAVTSNAGDIDAAALSDGDLTDGPTLTAKGDGLWMTYRYAEPVTIEGITTAVSGAHGDKVVTTLEYSADGKNWKPVPANFSSGPLIQSTFSFAPVTAQYFRVTFDPAPAGPSILQSIQTAPGMVPLMIPGAGSVAKSPFSIRLHELVLHADATVNAFEAKAGFTVAPDNYALETPAPIADGTAVQPADVVDLTSRMKPDGTLDWTPPAGHWIVLRMGYSLEGTTNHPAPANGTGLEADKLNAADVSAYLNDYLDGFPTLAGKSGHRGVNALTADSTEVGAQNWTDDILAQFRTLRGYDPTPYLPVLTGVVVGSKEKSDAFLWDFRRTINELLAKNHYAVIADVARARNMTNYGEALENMRASFGDDMEMRQYASVPMAAMWTYDPAKGPADTFVADIRGGASVAHIYGQNIVAAESMTSTMQPWTFAPRELKPIVDREFVLGVNRIFVHSSVHQPADNPPGFSLPFIGQYFNRLETWADEAGPWVRYMARCSYLLQQGRYVGDIAYFYGQEAPLTGLFGTKKIDVPPGYGFDFVNSDVLKNKLSVDEGALVTKSGMRYKVLYLGGSSEKMTLDVLRRIGDLVEHGAIVVGRRPVSSPGLKDDPAAFATLADHLFGNGTAERDIGAGKVFPSGALTEALDALKLSPDMTYTTSDSDSELLSIHRHLSNGDLYFFSNQRNRPGKFSVSLRIAGLTTQLWDAVTGKVSLAAYRVVDGRTHLTLDLPAYGSMFVVLRKGNAPTARAMPAPSETALATLDGPWTVAFEPNRGAPPRLEMPSLESWSDDGDSGVKYFSGTGVYTKNFTLSSIPRNARVLLDLGNVDELAHVSVNGRDMGVVWTQPFEVDVTNAIHSGNNELSIAVTNLWVNRLIGDQQPGARKYTFTTVPSYLASAPLRASGLLGPVRLMEIVSATGRAN